MRTIKTVLLVIAIVAVAACGAQDVPQDAGDWISIGNYTSYHEFNTEHSHCVAVFRDPNPIGVVSEHLALACVPH